MQVNADRISIITSNQMNGTIICQNTLANHWTSKHSQSTCVSRKPSENWNNELTTIHNWWLSIRYSWMQPCLCVLTGQKFRSLQRAKRNCCERLERTITDCANCYWWNYSMIHVFTMCAVINHSTVHVRVCECVSVCGVVLCRFDVSAWVVCVHWTNGFHASHRNHTHLFSALK